MTAPYYMARLGKPAAEAYLEFYERPHLEREKKQFAAFLRVDMAHAVMLTETGILSREQGGDILRALRAIEEAGVDTLPMDASRGSLLLQVEAALCERVGIDTAGRIHTGRSRLDQGPTARRLYKRDRMLRCMRAMDPLRQALLSLAEAHVDTLMPGYTCLQHSHPGTFGHYLIGFCDKLADDHARLAESFARVNRSPLGSAGLSGTAWPIDRNRTASLLGFDRVIRNAKIAREAYYAAEIASGLAFLMSTLNDLATDLHIWCSYEFGMVELDAALCGTSSMFPQKRNPSSLEAVRYAAGEAVNWHATALTVFRGEGTGDVSMRELPLLDNAFEIVAGSLALMTGVMSTLAVRDERMAELAQANWSTSSELADGMVRSAGLSYRQAHSVVGRLVANCLKRGVAANEVTPELLEEAAAEMLGREIGLSSTDIAGALDARTFVETRHSAGGTAREQMRLQIEGSRNDADADAAWLDDRTNALDDAESRLRDAIASLTADGR